uniref:Uncharacterized protein n=1 Tax=Magnetococcus massalia (strain MO-1) TaxID=451514 RepID=A0A1S7LJ67_MAGMO|nr:protein of unknown function [Candidatus Magnetococcus massalia]
MGIFAKSQSDDREQEELAALLNSSTPLDQDYRIQ